MYNFGAIILLIAIIGQVATGSYIYSAANSITDDAVAQIDALTATAINSQLEVFEGRVRGNELKHLIDSIDNLNFEGYVSNDITYNISKDEIDEESYYNVKFEYDKSGVIHNAIIEEQ